MDTIANDTIILVVRNNGMMEPHPSLTTGQMLQIAEQIRNTVLAMPVMRATPANGKQPAPQPTPIEA